MTGRPRASLSASKPVTATAASRSLSPSFQPARPPEKAGVEFVAADRPHADRLTVGIMALVVEEEARMTSARAKAARAAGKARGVWLRNPRPRPWGAHSAAEARAAEAALYPYAACWAGATTLQQLADALMARGVHAPRGGERWRPEQVRRVLVRSSSAV